MIKLKSLLNNKLREAAWPKDLRRVWSFWMSPSGELHEVEDDGGHEYLGAKILKREYNIDVDYEKHYLGKYVDIRKLLHEKGWKEVNPARIRDVRCLFITPKLPELTSSQRKTLEDMASDTNRSVFYDDMNITPIFKIPNTNPFRDDHDWI
jgi:hypothetical protein